MGYIGSVVTEYLRERDIEVDVWDLKCKKDFFNLKASDLVGVNTVIHLAAIVGEEACDKDPRVANITNSKGAEFIADLCWKNWVNIIFASTCSVYGPDSLYKKSKLEGESYMRESEATIFRFGTAFGWSPSMRYNLVINKLVQDVRNHNRFTIFGGEQIRPFVHVRDIARIIYNALIKRIKGTHDLAIENISLFHLGQRLQKCFPRAVFNIDTDIRDKRSYEAHCPFEMKYSLEYGFREIWKNLWVTPQPEHLKPTQWQWLVSYPEKLKLGKCDVGAYTYINAQYGVEIGNGVQIGSHCSIYSSNTENNTYGPVVIEDGVKIGSHSLILPNTHIYKNKKIKAYSIIEGEVK